MQNCDQSLFGNTHTCHAIKGEKKEETEEKEETPTTEVKEEKVEFKFCPECGTPTNGGNFCVNCGYKLK